MNDYLSGKMSKYFAPKYQFVRMDKHTTDETDGRPMWNHNTLPPDPRNYRVAEYKKCLIGKNILIIFTLNVLYFITILVQKF